MTCFFFLFSLSFFFFCFTKARRGEVETYVENMSVTTNANRVPFCRVTFDDYNKKLRVMNLQRVELCTLETEYHYRSCYPRRACSKRWKISRAKYNVTSLPPRRFAFKRNLFAAAAGQSQVRSPERGTANRKTNRAATFNPIKNNYRTPESHVRIKWSSDYFAREIRHTLFNTRL